MGMNQAVGTVFSTNLLSYFAHSHPAAGWSQAWPKPGQFVEVCATGREREGVGCAAQVNQCSLWVKKPLQVTGIVPMLLSVCKQDSQLAPRDLFSLY